jgi:virginiamycin A acetyltransferase
MIEIHPSARISPLCDIEASVRGSKVIICENVVIDSFVKFKPAGGTGDVIVGAGTTINSGCVVYSGNGVLIGKNVAIASNCTLASTNHEYSNRKINIKDQGFRASKGGITVEDDVWIGANCVLLDGAIIRRGSVIGAGSVVRGEVPPYSICVGTPARVIATR